MDDKLFAATVLKLISIIMQFSIISHPLLNLQSSAMTRAPLMTLQSASYAAGSPTTLLLALVMR